MGEQQPDDLVTALAQDVALCLPGWPPTVNLALAEQIVRAVLARTDLVVARADAVPEQPDVWEFGAHLTGRREPDVVGPEADVRQFVAASSRAHLVRRRPAGPWEAFAGGDA